MAVEANERGRTMINRKDQRRTREELAFLPAALEILETPPHPAARVTALLIAGLFTAALAWSIWGRIDTVAVAQGQLVTMDRVKLVQPLESGVVRAIHVRDGQSVKQGEVLVELDPTEAQANVESLRFDLLKAQLDVASGSAILTDDPASSFAPPSGVGGDLAELTRLKMMGEWQKHLSAMAGLAAEIKDQDEALSTLKIELKKFEDTLPIIEERHSTIQDLYDQGLTRKPELLQLRQTMIETKASIVSNHAQQAQTQARRDTRVRKHEETAAAFRAEHLERRTEALRKAASLEQQILKEERRASDRKLRAPVDGTVFGLAVFTVGGVVTTKDVLMRLAPRGSELEAEVMILNKDIGFVREGQPVSIKLETFTFTRYGLIEGELKSVGRDAIQDEKQGLVYRAVAALKADKILVGDRWTPLAPGMAVQAEVKTGDRRVIEYFLSPLLRYRDESLRER